MKKIIILLLCNFTFIFSQQKIFTLADTLRGSYGPFRSNNDLTYYHLKVRVDPEKKYISGSNIIKWKMLKDDNRIQIDLYDHLSIDSIIWKNKKLLYERIYNAVFIDFPSELKKGSLQEIEFYYSGITLEKGRFGGITFKQDSLGNHWINTACQNIGASVWWPNKDQQPDEVDSMMMSVEVPEDLVDVSNGRFISKTILGDGYARFVWKINYPINNYSVSLNIGKYVHFSESLDDVTMDYYVMSYNLERAKNQFAQAKPMLACFEKYFGDYPFPKDGYKLIEAPYTGMEHQSAVTYGNLFKNGYYNKDWTGVGISTKFDYIIIHESGHEWFGNSVTANDISDAWIQEGWCTYSEVVYVECMFGYVDALKYVNSYKPKVKNLEPIIGPKGVNVWPGNDQYFKGALFLHTLRNIVNDDDLWWKLIFDYAQTFKYKNIWTEDVIKYFNTKTGKDFTSIFDQYLRFKNIPTFEYKFTNEGTEVRWVTDVEKFLMPVKIGKLSKNKVINPTNEWQEILYSEIPKEEFIVSDILFYINAVEIKSDR